MQTFASVIETWYAEHGRQLPWRMTKDPYKVWVSEIILQQTRVNQGYAYYQNFIRRFPTVEALAFASSDEVMQQWEGLGYYSRARNLHAASKQIVAQGGFPTDYEGIRALKGVGDYTAAAIASIVYDIPKAVVDGNVYRVLSRYFGEENAIDTTQGKKIFAALAQELLDTAHPAIYNQAIMDFGALQCTPKSPDCSGCPLVDSCVALAENKVNLLPIKSKKTAVKERYFNYLLLTKGNDLLIRRRGEDDIWAGLYEPLLFETFERLPQEELFARLKAAGLSSCNVLAAVENQKHQLTHRTLYASAYVLALSDSDEAYVQQLLSQGYIWVSREELGQYAAPRLVNIIYEKTSMA